MGCATNPCLYAFVGGVTNENFVLSLMTDNDSSVYMAGITWFAFEK
jgi:hypothetical protein